MMSCRIQGIFCPSVRPLFVGTAFKVLAWEPWPGVPGLGALAWGVWPGGPSLGALAWGALALESGLEALAWGP